jgi:uncharacterized protein YkwD
VTHSSYLRPLGIAALFFLSSLASGFAVTLLPQEQAIADYMVTDPNQGRPTMVLDPIIEQVARARARDMAVRNYFSHVNPDGVAANYLLRQAGCQLPAWWGADPTANYVESIAAGSPSASVTWTAWMNSPPHEVDLLGQNSFFATETHYGVGYYYDPNSTYQYYWVVITAPPQPLEITSPAPSDQVTTPSIGVAGTADPGANPASVQFRVENTSGTSAWQTATGVASWSGTASGLVPGPNIIRAQSLDGSGNLIDQTTCAITYLVEGTLTVGVSGSGSVTAGDAGVTSQAVGEPVTIKATPVSGYLFAGWTGSVASGSASLTFTMRDGMSIQANFQPSPFLAVGGAWYGILTSGSGAQGGLMRLAVSNSGLFTGRIQLSGAAYSFKGQLGSNGAATVNIGAITITVQADLGGAGQITGTVSDGSDTSSFALSQSTYNASTNAAPQAGRYTLVLPPDPSTTGASVPQGNGYAAIVVNADGTATMAGRLADGTPYSATGHLANDGTLAIFCVPSGAPAGSSVNGLLTFQSTDASDLNGALAWTKGPNAADPFYPAGFATRLPAIGSLYVRPTAGVRAMDVSNSTAIAGLGGGNLPQPINVPVVLNQQNKATMATPGSPDVTFSINPVSGAITGSFVMQKGNITRSVRGVIFQKQGSAFGYFRGLNQCGYFSLTPGT